MLPSTLTLRATTLEPPPGASEPWGHGRRRKRGGRRRREKEGQKRRVKEGMSALLMLATVVTSSSASLMSCLPLVSLIRVMMLPVLPVSLVPLPAASGAATEMTRHRDLYHYSPTTRHLSFSTPAAYPSPPHLSISPYPFPGKLTYPPPSLTSQLNPRRGFAGFTAAPSVRKSDGTEWEAVDNTSTSWAPEDTSGNDNTQNFSSSFYNYYAYSSSSLPPCVPEEIIVNGSDANDTCYLQDIDRSSKVGALMGREWVRIVGFSLIFVVGVVGNVLVVVTLLHHRNLRSLTNVFLLNLAVSDLLLGVFCMPFTLVGSLLQDFVFGALMCRLIPYMQAVSVSVSVWTLVAISLERFYAICQPLRSRRWQTASHAYKVIAGVWAASLLLMTPIAALSTLMPVRGDPGRHKCREVWVSLEAERTFTILLTVMLLLVPLVVMAVAYLRVVRTLWLGPHLPAASSNADGDLCGGVPVETGSPSRLASVSIRFRRAPSPRGPDGSVGNPQEQVQNTSPGGNPQQAPVGLVASPRLEHVCFGSGVPPTGGSRRWESDGGTRWRPLRSSQAQRSLVAKRRVVRMLFVLVAEFFICWTPLFLVNLLSLYIPRQVYAALGSFGVSLVQLLAYLSSCCNPLTYCFMNAKFIQSFKLAFACTRRRPPASLRGVALVSSFRSVGISCHHDPVPLRPSPGQPTACRNGATHAASQGTNV